MKKVMQLMLFPILMILATQAWSSTVVHIYSCEQEESATEEQLEAHISKWLKAAKKMKGGEHLEVQLYFPMAAQMDQYDFMLILTVPSFADWGMFMEGVHGSVAGQIEDEFGDLGDCPDSGLFESITIKAE
jgi:hypothetical protein